MAMESDSDKLDQSLKSGHDQEQKSSPDAPKGDPNISNTVGDTLRTTKEQGQSVSERPEKPGTSTNKVDSATEEEWEYESEPASVKSLENRRKRKLSLKESQGKTMYPPSKTSARELRELTRKHFMLEKNLKIEGIPEQPKMRKRRMSLNANFGRVKDVPHKRQRLMSVTVDRPKKGHMPNWGSFGGDATDPLNLNGLQHSEEGRLLNLKTPENSPLPTPDFRKIVYVKVPPNIEDPLNLEGRHDQNYINKLLNSTRKKRHRSKKNKDNVNQSKDTKLDVDAKSAANENLMSDGGVSEVEEPSLPLPLQPPSLPPPKQKTDSSAPQNQSAVGKRSRSRSLSTSPERKLKRQLSGLKGSRPVTNEPKKFPEKPMFIHGNYNRYYGYRNRDQEPDPRMRYFNPHLFEDKDVLDIGCNVGHVTLAIAQYFHPRKILGMDIDGKLIRAARQNMRHMLSHRIKDSSKYPSVFEMVRGPIEAHPLTGSSNQFPNNILFLQGNYVPVSEDILRLQREEYDTILALSITKWIHLNNGDHGLKLFFQKIVQQLRPGGHLILEPQPWSTYRKRAKLTPDLFKNYSSIKLKPEGFKNYLLKIGFVKCEVIGVPVTKAKGFRRPLILFTKADRSNSSSNSLSQSLPTCTECSEGDQSECDHIQFTGMRRGAYADRLYDHISYNPCLRMPEANTVVSSSTFGRSYPMQSPMSIAFMVCSPLRDLPSYLPSSTSPSTMPHLSVPLPLSNSSASGSQHRSESGQSCSSSGSGSSSQSSQSSGSGSGSSYSEASSPLVNGGVEPVLHGHNGGGLNGDIAEEIVWVNNGVNDENDGMNDENNGVNNENDVDNNAFLQEEHGVHPVNNNDLDPSDQVNPNNGSVG